MAMQSKKRRFGLSGKLVLAILAVGSAAKVDAELQRILIVESVLAQQAAVDPEVRSYLFTSQNWDRNSSAVQFDWPPITEAESAIGARKASWVTGPEGGPDGAKTATSFTENAAARVTGLYLNSATQHHLLHISAPIYGEKEMPPIGWLHRDYDKFI